MLKRLIFSTLLIYSYDLLNLSLRTVIPINFFTVLFVYLFGFFGMAGLICFSFIF
jgi:hypothetical protein